MWAYRTSIITFIGETPFSLTYGEEVIVPLELKIPSLPVSLDGLILDEDRRKARLTQLEVLDEKYVNALEYLCVHHYRIQKAYSKKIKPKKFNVGDLVLKKNLTNTKALENERKVSLNLTG